LSFYTQFAETYESIFPFSAAVYGFLRRHLPPAPAHVLDVGCGTGHYAGSLSQDGFTATAVDLDAAMIDYARAHYPAVDFHVMNMLDIGRLRQCFGGVACIGNTAAHLTRTQFGEFTGAVRDALAPGGPFILQVMNWDYVLTQTMVTFPVIEGDGDAIFCRAYRDISEMQVTFATRLEVRGETVFEDAVPLFAMRSAEIIAAAAEHGLKLVEHVGSYGGSPFDAEVFSANVMVFERVSGSASKRKGEKGDAPRSGTESVNGAAESANARMGESRRLEIGVELSGFGVKPHRSLVQSELSHLRSRRGTRARELVLQEHTPLRCTDTWGARSLTVAIC